MPAKQKPRTPYWIKAINEAKKTGKFTEDQRSKAASWVTCACGKQDKFIPRNSFGAPIDKRLDMLGLDFYRNVRDACPYTAEETLAFIERRAAEILFGDDLEANL